MFFFSSFIIINYALDFFCQVPYFLRGFYTPPAPFLFLRYFNMGNFKRIPIDKLKSPEFDTRLTSSPDEDDELKESIRELGVLLPLLVKDIGNGYEIIAGNRRHRAAERAGLASVPCEVLKVTGSESDKIKIHENLKRLPLSHIDQAMTFAYFIKEYNMTETQVATLIGMSIAYVSQHLAVLHSDDKILQAVHDGRINFSVARELNMCKDPDERERLQDVVEEHGASSVVVQGWVHDSNRETDTINKNKESPGLDVRTADPPHPLYPCHACGVPIDSSKIRVIHLCGDCHFLIFQPIEEEKRNLRIKGTIQTHETPQRGNISTLGDHTP